MRNMVKYLGIAAFVAVVVIFSACKFELSTRPEAVPDEFIPVEDITGIPTGSLPYLEITLSGTVMPANATNKKIEWSIAAEGGTRAALERNRLTANDYGTVTVTARIKNGLGGNVDYTQNFNILISATMIAVTSIEGIPATVPLGDYTLNGKVRPSNTLNKTITWSVKEAGATGAEIYGNILTTTAEGTAVITATVTNGKLDSDYTQDFTVTVYIPFVAVTGITGIPSTVLIGNYELNGAVTPLNATNQTITWTLIDAGETGAVLDGNTLTTTAEGTVEIKATVANGRLIGNYTQDFSINVTETYIEVTEITGIPTTVLVGDYELEGVVEPFDAANTAIVWSVKDAGTTGASVSGNTLTTTAGGTVAVTATIAGGLLTGNYTQDFEIIIFIIPVTGITGIQTTIEIGDYELNGVVDPANATHTAIVWSVKDPGVTGAEIDGNTLTTTAAGTAVITATVADGLPDGDYTQDFTITVNIIPVTAITGIPSTVLMGGHELHGVVQPPNATHTTITWAVKTAGATGAEMSGNTLTTTAGGTVTVTATVAGGTLAGDYTQDFEINITESFVPVTGISGIPAKVPAGDYTLTGAVAPTNASNKNIEWSVKDAGTTNASISGNTLNTTAAGTVTVTATIVDGVSDTEDYTQDFDIVTIVVVTGITGIQSSLLVGEYELNGAVAPPNATHTTITWVVKNAGGTGAAISYDEYNNLLLTTTAAGTAVITATVADGSLDGDYTQDFTVAVKSVYAVGSYPTSNPIVGTKACYWKDGEIYDVLHSDEWLLSSATGIVAANGKLYIAGTYVTSIMPPVSDACYWVVKPDNGTVEKVVTLPKTEDAYPQTKSIAVDGTTVYITGYESVGNNASIVCYWKDDGMPQQTVLELEDLQTDVLLDTADYTGRFAINNGNLYIPFRYYWTPEGGNAWDRAYKCVYWDGSATHEISDLSSWTVFDVAILDNRVYMVGAAPSFYWIVGDTERTFLTGGQRVTFIFVQNGNLRFYGCNSDNTGLYWDMEGEQYSFDYQHNWTNDIVVIAAGDNVLVSYLSEWNSGYAIVGGGEQGDDYIQLHDSSENDRDIKVMGLAVH